MSKTLFAHMVSTEEEERVKNIRDKYMKKEKVKAIDADKFIITRSIKILKNKLDEIRKNFVF